METYTPGYTSAAEAFMVRRRLDPNGAFFIDFRQGSAYELPFAEDTFDAVFSHALLEHPRDPGRAAAEFRRVLKPGGMPGACTPG